MTKCPYIRIVLGTIRSDRSKSVRRHSLMEG
jgi:hypothetical protein